MKIAVIGAGIAGLGAAYALSRVHEVELFEQNDYPGGHTHTVSLSRGGREIALDTGFIVHNEPSYPNLVRLFRELGVRTQDSEMSFSVSCGSCRLEYSGRRPFAQPANAVRPAFLGLLREIARFLGTARRKLENPHYEDATLDRFIEQEGYSAGFRDHYLIPLTASIWSTAPGRALDFPASYAVRFFENHGMLGFRRHTWKTVVGGSHEYVRAILERLPGGVQLRNEVLAIRRDADGAELTTASGATHRLDKVVIATHADEALALLADPSDDERRILGAFDYTRNETVLHTDESLLPTARAARASWNYRVADCGQPSVSPTITYYLNRLQGLHEADDFCVTLNRSVDIREDRVIRRLSYDHPLYTLESLRAQKELGLLANVRHTAYCGAYHGFGFHEDGLVSGLGAARLFGADW